MLKKDQKELEVIIDLILTELAEKLRKVEGRNLLSLSLAGSTVHNDFKYNQDVDLVLILKKIKNEDLLAIKNDLTKITQGEMDLEYKTSVPEIKKIFEEIVKKYSSFMTAIKYKFTLGNYWGKPEKQKKYTIHLHVIGPHSLKSFNLRMNKFHKVILTNVVQNSKPLAGKDLKSYFPPNVSRSDIIQTLKMLQKRQISAMGFINTDLASALTISIKNLAKIAMVALESKNVFENRSLVAGELFFKKFKLPYNDLPKRVDYLKKNKETVIKNTEKTKKLIQQTGILLDELIKII